LQVFRYSLPAHLLKDMQILLLQFAFILI